PGPTPLVFDAARAQVLRGYARRGRNLHGARLVWPRDRHTGKNPHDHEYAITPRRRKKAEAKWFGAGRAFPTYQHPMISALPGRTYMCRAAHRSDLASQLILIVHSAAPTPCRFRKA